MNFFTNRKNVSGLLKSTLSTGMFLLCMFLSMRSDAQLPANDNPCNATTITVGTTCGFVPTTNVNATATAGVPAPLCGNYLGGDIWFQCVIPASGAIIIDTRAGTGAGGLSDGAIAYYTGTCTNLTYVACNDDDSPTSPGMGYLNVSGTVGSTVFVRAWGFGGASGTFDICIKSAAPPPPPLTNDDPCNAIDIPVAATCNFANYSTVGATATAGVPAPGCASYAGSDVWFKTTVPPNGALIIDTNVGTITDGGMAIYSGTCTGLTLIECDDDDSNNGNMPYIYRTGLTPGSTIWIRFWKYNGGTGTFSICVTTPPPPPANDDCAGSVLVPTNLDFNCGQTINGNTQSATPSTGAPAPTCGTVTGVNDDVWFRFVANGSTHRVSLTNINPTGTSMTMVVYSGGCGGLVPVVGGCANANVLNLTGLTNGTTYYVRVYTNVATATTFASFTICVGTPPPPPANDECAGAVNLTVNPDLNCAASTNGTTFGATQSTTTPLPSCGLAGGYNDDVWYTFTALNANHRVTLTNITGDVTALTMNVYRGSCATALTALTPPACIVGNTLDLVGLTVGQIYTVRVFTNVAAPLTFANFTICVGTIPPPPVNDDPCNAIQLTVGATCNYATYTTFSATASAGVPAPGCANYVGGDVWFKVTVPTSGNLLIDTQTGVITDGGMAIYSGSCTGLTLIACDDDSSPNGLMPQILRKCATGLTPGATIWVRFWAYGTSAPGTFGICVTEPTGANVSTLCNNAIAFCSSTTYTYPSSTNVPSLGGTTDGSGVFGCLQTTPNPAFYYMQIQQSGNLLFNISQIPTAGGNGDVDFALYGPFTSVSQACTQLGATCPTIVPLPNITGQQIGCSYSIAAVEAASIANAIAGQIYVVLITNFSNQPGVITLNQTGGTGTTNCNIVCNATAGNSGPACPGGLFNLTGNTTIGGASYSWTGPNGFTSTQQNPTNVVAPATAGSYIYTLTVRAGQNVCTATTTLVVSAPPAAPSAQTPVNICQFANAAPLTATGTALLWYTTATGGTGSATAPTPVTTTAGTFHYYVSQTVGCESARTDITVNVTPGPNAPTVTTPVIYCQNAPSAPLTATGTNLMWYTTATGGTGTATAPTPSTANVGTTNYYVSQTGATCESPRALIAVRVDTTAPAPIVTPTITYCLGAQPAQLTAQGQGLLWYTTATGGTGTTTAPTPTTTTAGTTIYYVSQKIGNCEGPRAAITVNVVANPAAPVVTPLVTYCQNAQASPLSAQGTGLIWYTTPTGGTGTATPPTPSTAAPGDVIYYVASTAGTCTSPRSQITVHVNPTPAAPIVSTAPVNYCQNASAIALTAQGTNLLYYTSATGGTGSATLIPVTSAPGQFNYYVSQTTSTCEGPRSLISVNVSPLLTVNAGQDVTIGLGSQVQLNATATPGANYLWTANVSPLALSNPAILNPVANPIQTTTYTLTVSDPQSICASVNDNVIVNVIVDCINVRNAFSPNGDGVNDLWKVYENYLCLSNVTLQVYNRYGNKVFESVNYRNSWNGTYKGKAVPDGTYYAVIEFTLSNGTKQYVRTDLTIIR